MKRPGYREAVEWLACNDDCYCLFDKNNPSLTVAAALVRDIYDVPQEKLLADVKRMVARVYPDHEVLRGE